MSRALPPESLLRRLPGRWIDVSRPLADDTPVWPGDRPFRRGEQISAGVTVSWLTTTCHVGSHLEGPRHLDPGAPSVETLTVERLIGPAEVVALAAGTVDVSPGCFPPGWAPRAPRLLLRTDSHPRGATIGPGFAALTAAAVTWLAERGVDLVGVDTPSVDAFDASDLPAHRELTRRHMVWLEGLTLTHVDPGLYLLVALPLPLVGAEASPVRAVLGAWDSVSP